MVFFSHRGDHAHLAIQTLGVSPPNVNKFTGVTKTNHEKNKKILGCEKMYGTIAIIIGVLLFTLLSGAVKRVVFNRETGQTMYVGGNADDLYLGEQQQAGYYEGEVGAQEQVYRAPPGYQLVRTAPTSPLNKPVTVIPEGGGVRATPLKPTLHRRRIRPTEFDELGTRAYLRRNDNELDTTAPILLTANTINVWSTIFQYTIPNNRDLHFKPQNWQARDASCPACMLLLTSDETGVTEIYGDYQIRVENANETGTKAILASGVLAEFAIQGALTATLNDVQNKVYYTEDYEATEGDIIMIRINSPTVIDTSGSHVWLGHYVYVP